jgi:hypothetical protein
MNLVLAFVRHRFRGLALSALIALLPFTVLPANAQEDDYKLLPEGEGRDEVYAICGGCHSIKMVIQQGLPRDRWNYLFDWMVEEQGMAELDMETRTTLLNYLDRHFNTDHRPTYIKR